MERLKKERQILEDCASKLLTYTLKAGAQSAEVCATYGTTTKILLEKQDFHLALSDDTYQFGVRALIDGRQGFASTNSIDPKEIKNLAHKAVEIAKVSPQNKNQVILSTENIYKDAPNNLFDDALFDLSLQTQKDWAKILVEEPTRDPRFRLNDGSVSIGASLFLVISSLGTYKLERDTQLTWGLMGMAVEGENITSFDYFSEISRKATGAPDRIVESAKKFRNLMVSNLNCGAASSYQGLVAFSPRAVMDVLISPLESHINGRNVVEGTSRWTLKNLMSIVVSPSLTIVDRPWLIDRFGCTVFDREGTPTHEKTVILKGVLQDFFTDQYAAHYLNKACTGNAVGGATGIASVSSHCISVEPGTETLVDIYNKALNDQTNLLLVHRFSGQVDPITGDFSGVAKGAEWWHKGELAYFVKETLISGNIFECLKDNLIAISKEAEVVDGQGNYPTFLVDKVSVTAGAK